MDYLDGELQEGESYLLLSDGVWSCVPERDIAHILHDQPDLGAAARALVSLAHQSGSQDNASALLLRVDALPEAVLADTLAQLDHWPLPPKLRAGQTFEGWQVTALLHESRQSLIYRVLDGQGQPWLLKTLPPSRQDELDAGPPCCRKSGSCAASPGGTSPSCIPCHSASISITCSASTPAAPWRDASQKKVRCHLPIYCRSPHG